MFTTSCGSLAVNCVKSPVRPGRLVAAADQLLRRRLQVLDRPAALVEQLVGEAAELAQAVDRRRQKRMTIAPVIWLNAPNSSPTTALAECASPGRSLKSFSCAKRMPWFGAVPVKPKPPAREQLLRLRHLHHDLLGLLHDAHRVVERRALRRLDEHDDVALILVGHEAGRHARVDPVGRAEQRDEHERDQRAHANQAAQHRHHQRRAAVDDAVHAAEEDALRLLAFASSSAGERRRQRQRVEGGDRHRHGDRQRELLIQAAGRAREERHRHEHRDQHQRRRDDRARHLAHRGRRRLRAPAGDS